MITGAYRKLLQPRIFRTKAWLITAWLIGLFSFKYLNEELKFIFQQIGYNDASVISNDFLVTFFYEL